MLSFYYVGNVGYVGYGLKSARKHTARAMWELIAIKITKYNFSELSFKNSQYSQQKAKSRFQARLSRRSNRPKK